MSPLPLRYREGAEFEFGPDLEVVVPLLEQMQRYLSERGFPAAEFGALELAVAEALNNAIVHGCADQPDAPLLLRWGWSEDLLEIVVRDPGHFEPPADWAELPDDPLAESGRGGFLISSYFDQVEHQNGPAGHALYLRKHTAVRPQAPNLAAVEEELGLMTQDLSDSYESLAALFSISALLATSATFEEFLAGVLHRLRGLISADLVYARLQLPTKGWTVHFDRSGEHVRAPQPTLSPLEETVWTSRRLRSHDESSLPETEPLRQWQAGLVVCPIGFQREHIGLITAGRREGSPFTAGQTNLVRTVADFVGIAHTTARLHRQREQQLRDLRELEIAAQIQKSLLPTSFPTNAHWAVHGVCESAQAVGGDFFDAVVGADGHILIVVADVMGKGVPAAMFSSLLRASARARLDLAADPGALLTELNRLVAPDLEALGMFITAAVASLAPDGSSLTIASAGHPTPLAFRPGVAPARELAIDAGMPLGILPDTVYANASLCLRPGEIVVLGTDGLYEFDDGHGAMFGTERLAASLPTWWTGQLSTFAAETLSHLQQLEQGHQADDRTLVVFTRLATAT